MTSNIGKRNPCRYTYLPQLLTSYTEVRNEVAFQQAWKRISERYHGEKLTPAKGRVVLEIYRALDESVEKRIISKEDACKAAEIAFVVAHRESDLNPEAKNPKSSATGVFQQMETFPQRNKIDNWSVRKQPLTRGTKIQVGGSASVRCTLCPPHCKLPSHSHLSRPAINTG
jgi:hypothetical protein